MKSVSAKTGFIAIIAAIMAFFPMAIVAAYGGGSVQGYSAEKKLNNGSIVTLVDSEKSKVALATQKSDKGMFGVTVNKQQLPVTLSNEGLKNEVFVAVSGTYNVLVSTQNGAINSGDFVTLSSIEGVAAKAGTEEENVLGRAGGSFDGKGVTLGTTSLKDDKGNEKKQVKLGLIPVTIDITKNPNKETTRVKAPEFLKEVGQQIARKPVSPIRIYISLAITAASIIIALVMLYSGIKNGVVAIGRNPMSKKSIFRALLETILTSILILIIGLFTVYLLLRL